MIGAKNNKIKHHQKKASRGQALLVVVMILATTLTVVFSLSFQSITDTQMTKLEEEAQKTLAAAEAAIDVALKEGQAVFGSGSLANLTGFTGGATVETASFPTFLTPLLQKDEQYTFYLSQPGPNAPQQPDFTNLISRYNNVPLTICSTNGNLALELILIKGPTPSTMKRFFINPPEIAIIQNGTQANGLGSCPRGENFSYRHQLTAAEVGNNNLLLIVRMVNGSGKVGFTAGSGNLPLQGKTIVSEAKSAGGVTKKVQLFQSYPQIPTEFFITTF